MWIYLIYSSTGVGSNAFSSCSNDAALTHARGRLASAAL
jgi:hypothetical protein